ncbi:T9SS type A sorting domain-containing protein, partial [Winogradskyella immobilis]
FEIVFQNNTLSTDDEIIQDNGLSIVELTDGNVQFTIKNSNLTIDTVTIFDLQGRLIYDLEGDSSIEIYNLSNLGTSAYIAKVLLSNGQTVTQKSIKK